MRALLLFAPLLLIAPGCEGAFAEAPPALAVSPPAPVYGYATGPGREAAPAKPAAELAKSEPLPAAGKAHVKLAPADVLVTRGMHLTRPTEVIGIVDVREEQGHHAAALDDLRRKASELGADAVLDVELYHDEGQSSPTHLAGLAVRFVEMAN